MICPPHQGKHWLGLRMTTLYAWQDYQNHPVPTETKWETCQASNLDCCIQVLLQKIYGESDPVTGRKQKRDFLSRSSESAAGKFNALGIRNTHFFQQNKRGI